MDPVPIETERVATAVVDAAFNVHKTLGPGLLESVYETCFCYELKSKGLGYACQVLLPITYRGVHLDGGLRLDVYVEGKVIVELKAVEKLSPLFDAQVLTYLKLTGARLGLLINFNVPLIKDAIRRIVL